MATRSDDMQRAEFVDANLRGARFRRADLSGVVMRAVDVRGADIDVSVGGEWSFAQTLRHLVLEARARLDSYQGVTDADACPQTATTRVLSDRVLSDWGPVGPPGR